MAAFELRTQESRLDLLAVQPPPRAGCEEGAKIVGADARLEIDFALHCRIAESGKRQQHRKTRHSARIVIAPLNLVPGIATYTVVAIANAFDDIQTFFDHSPIDKVRCHLVCDARPNLI